MMNDPLKLLFYQMVVVLLLLELVWYIIIQTSH